MNRRQWLERAAVTSWAAFHVPQTAAADNLSAKSSQKAEPTTRPVDGWTIGVCNRPWTTWGIDDAIKGAQTAGFSAFGLISAQQGQHLTAATVSATSLDSLKRRIADGGLDLVLTSIRFRVDDPLPALKDDVAQQVENAARLGARFVMTFGVDRPEHFTKFEQLMSDAATRAAAAGVRLVIKPHGGITLGPDEILRCLERVGHPNLSVWYDPGNTIYYTEGDPVAAYVPIAKQVSGLCAKDCARRRGDVMIPFGEGRVDFPALLTRMNAAGFDGPILIEGVRVGATAEETAANAKANRLFLERAVAAARKR